MLEPPHHTPVNSWHALSSCRSNISTTQTIKILWEETTNKIYRWNTTSQYQPIYMQEFATFVFVNLPLIIVAGCNVALPLIRIAWVFRMIAPFDRLMEWDIFTALCTLIVMDWRPSSIKMLYSKSSFIDSAVPTRWVFPVPAYEGPGLLFLPLR